MGGSAYAQVAEASQALATRINAANKRTLDVFGGKAWGYYSLAHEKTGSLDTIRSYVDACCRVRAVCAWRVWMCAVCVRFFGG